LLSLGAGNKGLRDVLVITVRIRDSGLGLVSIRTGQIEPDGVAAMTSSPSNAKLDYAVGIRGFLS